MIKNFEQLISRVQKSKKIKKAAVIAAHDEHTLEAVLKAKAHHIIEPVLIGDADKIKSLLQKLQGSMQEGFFIDIKDEAEAARKGVALANLRQVDLLMKGKIQTADLLKAVVDKEHGLRTDRIMSHFVINEIPSYHKLLVTTDGGMVLYPSLDDKRKILENAVEILNTLGYKKPKVAALAAVENINEKMPETLDAAALKKMNQEGRLANCLVEGPISYDLAISKASADIKGYDSPVAGDADILLVPNITVGNVLGKSILFSGGAKMAGFIVGAKVPIVLTSRGATSEEKYLSLVISAASA